MGNFCWQNQKCNLWQCSSTNLKTKAVIVLLIPFLFLILTPRVNAQNGGGTQSRSGFGINGMITHTPAEGDLSDTGGDEDIDKLEIYLDWEWLRFGYNKTHAALDFALYNNNWITRLKKDTTYLAYRLSSAESQSSWDLFLLAGLAYTEASFTITNIATYTSSDIGYMGGGGIFSIMGDISLGIEVLVISTHGTFDELKIATGSTQVLSGFKYSF